jgi:putative DNA primase/helicase
MTPLRRVMEKAGKGPTANGVPPAGPIPEPPKRFVPALQLMSELKLREVKWHWPGRIPAGMVTILFGPPGVSKSIVTCFITAATTVGGFWPGGYTRAPKGTVVMLACEDEPETTVGPRLLAAGADLTKVRLLVGKRPDGQDDGKGFALAVSLQDIELIEESLDPDCKLLIVDPAGSHMGPGIDNHRDNEVRAVLMPLALLARKRGIAVVLVCHSNKAMANQLAMDAIIGSRGFSGVVRSVLSCVADPDAADYPRRKLLLHAKCNVAPLADGLAYTLESAPDVIGQPPRIVWEDEPLPGVGADDYLGARSATRTGGETGRPASAREEAAALIERVLADGPASVARMKAVAQAAGMSWPTVDRARADLGVKGKPQKGKFEVGKRPLYFWYFGDDWEPPAADPSLDPEGFDADGETGGENTAETPEKTRQHQHQNPSDADGEFRPSASKPAAFDADGETDGQSARQHQISSDVDAHRKTQAEMGHSGGGIARQHQNPESLDGARKNRREKSTPISPAVVELETLLSRSGWAEPEAIGWLDGQDEYVPDHKLANLTARQQTLLAAKLAEVIRERGR